MVSPSSLDKTKGEEIKSVRWCTKLSSVGVVAISGLFDYAVKTNNVYTGTVSEPSLGSEPYLSHLLPLRKFFAQVD